MVDCMVGIRVTSKRNRVAPWLVGGCGGKNEVFEVGLLFFVFALTRLARAYHPGILWLMWSNMIHVAATSYLSGTQYVT